MSEIIGTAYVDVRPRVQDFRTETEQGVKQQLGTKPVPIAGQLQLGGLEDARKQVEGLTDSLAATGQLDLGDAIAPLAGDVQAVREEADALATSFAGVSSSLSGDLTGGLAEAGADTAALADSAQGLGVSFADAQAAAGGMIASTGKVVAIEKQATAALVSEQKEITKLSLLERLREAFNLKSRRPTGVGPFRIAGVGLGVASAVFAGTQALGELAGALEVVDGRTATTGTRLRNFGANVLRGNLVGAFAALTDETRKYSEAQLVAIQGQPEFIENMKKMGQGASIAAAQLAALTEIVKPAQQFQTRSAKLEFEGATDSEVLANLDAELATQKQVEARIRAVGGEGMSAALEEMFKHFSDIKDKAAKIRDVDALAPLDEALRVAELSGGSMLPALEASRAQLVDLIAASSDDAEKRAEFQDKLISVNQQIETEQAGIKAESQRHQEAMLSARLDPFAEAVLDATIAGGSGLAGALAAQRDEINTILNGKNLTRDQRLELKNQLVGINSQIESIQAEIVAEEERHAAEMEAAREAAHQALLEGLGLQEQELRTSQMMAQLTKSTADDKARLNALIAFYRQAARTQDLTRQESLNFQQSLIGAQLELQRMNQEEKRARQEEKKRRAEERKRNAEARKEAANAKKDVKATGAERASFEELAASFLQQQQGFAANLASNLHPAGTKIGGPDLAGGGGGRGRGGRAARISPFLLDDENLPPAVAAEREREENRPMTALQGTAVIHELRTMRRTLGDVRQDSAHPEARTRRIQARTAVETGVD